eukprot:1417430-Rhodomonas_salina.1
MNMFTLLPHCPTTKPLSSSSSHNRLSRLHPPPPLSASLRPGYSRSNEPSFSPLKTVAGPLNTCSSRSKGPSTFLLNTVAGPAHPRARRDLYRDGGECSDFESNLAEKTGLFSERGEKSEKERGLAKSGCLSRRRARAKGCDFDRRAAGQVTVEVVLLLVEGALHLAVEH